MRLDILTDGELFKLAAHQGEYNEHIDKEWKERYGLSFPYKLVKEDSKIYNALLNEEFDYDEVDKMVAKQAKMIEVK